MMNFIFDKKKDYILLLILPLIFFLFGAVISTKKDILHSVEAIFFLLTIRLVIDTPHFFMTALPTIRRLNEKSISVFKLLGVFSITLIVLLALYYYEFIYLVKFMIFMAHFHMYKQQQGWLSIYSAKNNSSKKYAQLAILVLTVGFMSSFVFTEQPKTIYFLSFVPESNFIVNTICAISFTIFTILSFLSWRHKEIALRTPVFWGTLVWFGGVYYFIQNEFFITLAMITLHPIPYMFFCAAYLKEDKFKKLKKVIGIYSIGFLTGLYLIVFLEGTEFKILILSFIIFFHYNMDAILWKRKNGFNPV